MALALRDDCARLDALSSGSVGAPSAGEEPYDHRPTCCAGFRFDRGNLNSANAAIIFRRPRHAYRADVQATTTCTPSTTPWRLNIAIPRCWAALQANPSRLHPALKPNSPLRCRSDENFSSNKSQNFYSSPLRSYSALLPAYTVKIRRPLSLSDIRSVWRQYSISGSAD